MVSDRLTNGASILYEATKEHWLSLIFQLLSDNITAWISYRLWGHRLFCKWQIWLLHTTDDYSRRGGTCRAGVITSQGVGGGGNVRVKSNTGTFVVMMDW